MEGIFAAFNFKGIDKNFSDKDYFYSPHSKIVKKEKFIFVIGKNKIYLSTNGTLNIIDLSDGKSKKIVNINKKLADTHNIFFIFFKSLSIKLFSIK